MISGGNNIINPDLRVMKAMYPANYGGAVNSEVDTDLLERVVFEIVGPGTLMVLEQSGAVGSDTDCTTILTIDGNEIFNGTGQNSLIGAGGVNFLERLMVDDASYKSGIYARGIPFNESIKLSHQYSVATAGKTVSNVYKIITFNE